MKKQASLAINVCGCFKLVMSEMSGQEKKWSTILASELFTVMQTPFAQNNFKVDHTAQYNKMEGSAQSKYW